MISVTLIGLAAVGAAASVFMAVLAWEQRRDRKKTLNDSS